MAVVEIADADDPALGDPRLGDYARATDVALRKARGTEHGIYIAESTLVLERALRAGHTARSVLALPSWVDAARALVGEDVPVFTGPSEVLADLTGYVLHRGVIAAMNRPQPPDRPPCCRTPAGWSCSRTSPTRPTSARSSARSARSERMPCSSPRAAPTRSTAAPSG